MNKYLVVSMICLFNLFANALTSSSNSSNEPGTIDAAEEVKTKHSFKVLCRDIFLDLNKDINGTENVISVSAPSISDVRLNGDITKAKFCVTVESLN